MSDIWLIFRDSTYKNAVSIPHSIHHPEGISTTTKTFQSVVHNHKSPLLLIILFNNSPTHFVIPKGSQQPPTHSKVSYIITKVRFSQWFSLIILPLPLSSRRDLNSHQNIPKLPKKRQKYILMPKVVISWFCSPAWTQILFCFDPTSYPNQNRLQKRLGVEDGYSCPNNLTYLFPPSHCYFI